MKRIALLVLAVLAVLSLMSLHAADAPRLWKIPPIWPAPTLAELDAGTELR